MAATGEPYSVAARALAAAEAAGAAAEPVADAGSVADPGSVGDPGREADRADALTEVIACAGRTLAASSARIQIRADTDLGRDPVPALRRPLRRRPGLGGPAGRPGRPWGASRPEPPRPGSATTSCTSSARVSSIPPTAGTSLTTAASAGAGRRPALRRPDRRAARPRYELRPHQIRRDDPLDALRKLQRATAARWAARTGALDNLPGARPRRRGRVHGLDRRPARPAVPDVERAQALRPRDQDRDGRAVGLRRPGRRARLVPAAQLPHASSSQRSRLPPVRVSPGPSGPQPASSSRTRGTTSVP